MAHEVRPRVLVGDDQSDVLTALWLLLRDAGLQVDTATSVQEIRNRLRTQPYDLLLMDLNYARDTTSGSEGLDLLTEVHATDPLLPVVVMTGWGSIDTAVEAMRRGARGFISKPWDNHALAAAMCREVEDGRARRRADRFATREQQEAQEIQRALLPRDCLTIGACTMAVRCIPAATFGGDCYDMVRVDDGRIAIWIADVCGKGLPAALVMANLQASTRGFAAADSTPRRVASSVNAELASRTGLRRFVTFFYALYDSSARHLMFTNAGHHAPLIISRDGSIERLTTGGPLLGAVPDASFDQGRIDVMPGDRLVLFTDGITEASSPDQTEFGQDRLLEVIKANRLRSGPEIVDAVFDEVARFALAPLQDDATVFVVSVG